MNVPQTPNYDLFPFLCRLRPHTSSNPDSFQKIVLQLSDFQIQEIRCVAPAHLSFQVFVSCAHHGMFAEDRLVHLSAIQIVFCVCEITKYQCISLLGFFFKLKL